MGAGPVVSVVMASLYKLFKNNMPDTKVLINSIPKSGTNLLLRVFSNLEYMHDAGMGTITDIDWRMRGYQRKIVEECIAEIERIQDREYQTAHLAYNRQLSDSLKRHNISHILIVRDPRDVVVSTAFYLSREANDIFHDYFSCLKSDRDRIIAAIEGVHSELAEGNTLPSIADFFKKYTPWLYDERCLVVRFEDLVGPNGGGDEARQIEAVKKITRHAGFMMTPKNISELAKTVFSDRSRTFRRGSIGCWKEWLDDELIEMIKSRKETFRPFGYEM